jgi:tetratricopeptide (TPR) repeat protein
LASSYVSLRDQGWSSLDADQTAATLALARSAIEVDGEDVVALQVSGMTLAGLGGDLDMGLSLLDRALAVAPSHAETWARSSMVRIYAGDLKTAEQHAEMALRLSPDNDPPFLPLCALGYAWLFSDRYAQALQAARRVLSGLSRPPMAYAILAAASHYIRDTKTAQKAGAALRAATPDFGVQAWTDQRCFAVPDQRHRLQLALSEVLQRP